MEFWKISTHAAKIWMDQSGGAVEYTVFISAEG